MSRSADPQRAFTIVEMLVVVSIIALLMAILLPSLAAVKNRSKKAQEMNNIRQVGFAWSQYGTANDGAAVPGYLDPADNPESIIERWDLSFEYPNHSSMPNNVAAPWTWRLMTYLDNSYEVVYGYREEDYQGMDDLVNNALLIAEEPAFGYNAYYTGGWWEMTTISDGGDSVTVPLPKYYDARSEDGDSISVVVKSIGQIQKTSDYVVFCSSTKRDESSEPPPTSKPGPAEDIDPGSFLVTPPYLADEQQWGHFLGDASYVSIYKNPCYHPIGRYTRTAAVLHADGHAEPQKPSTLDDARKWINIADTKDFTHLP